MQHRMYPFVFIYVDRVSVMESNKSTPSHQCSILDSKTRQKLCDFNTDVKSVLYDLFPRPGPWPVHNRMFF